MQVTQWSEALSSWLMGLGLPGWAAIFLVYAVGSFILINYGMLSVLLLIWITRKAISRIPVSYTHLTLPTKRIV